MEPAYPQKTSTTIDFDYCILCQETGNGELTVPGEKGTSKLKEALMRRKKLRDSKNRDAIERLKTIMDPSHETPLWWHRMCYSHYSHKKAKFKDYISHWKRHCNHQGQARPIGDTGEPSVSCTSGDADEWTREPRPARQQSKPVK